ncbi:MAG: hypothetical protein HY897_16185 [Deltaproteobacteria bacterium]|nr:hypothetical protein [Deltaproteobacteria bacterium]
MARFIKAAVALTAVLLVLASCENFKNVTAEVPLDTGENLVWEFDIDAATKGLQLPAPITIPTPDGDVEIKDYDELWDYVGNEDSPIPDEYRKFDLEVPLPPAPMPPEVTGDQSPVAPYKSKIYNVRVETISYEIVESSVTVPIDIPDALLIALKERKDADKPVNCLPASDPLLAALALQNNPDCFDRVAIAKIPSITSAKEGEAQDAEFAPGGKDAASDLLASLDFMISLGLEQNGSFSGTSIKLSIDTDKMKTRPKGKIKMKLVIKMVFRVAPLA